MDTYNKDKHIFMNKNMFKERINECTFDCVSLKEVYKRLCNMEFPYIWLKTNLEEEQLYLVEDIETKAEVISYTWQIDDIEFCGPILDVIELKLKRNSANKTVNVYKKISCEKSPKVCEATAESILKDAGIRFLSANEIETVNFIGDIPGNKKVVDYEIRKRQIEKMEMDISRDEKEVAALEKKKELLEGDFKEIELDIRRCEMDIQRTKQRIAKTKKQLKRNSL